MSITNADDARALKLYTSTNSSIIILTYNVLMLYVPCTFYINVCYFYFLIYSIDVPLCMIFNK